MRTPAVREGEYTKIATTIADAARVLLEELTELLALAGDTERAAKVVRACEYLDEAVKS